MVASALWRSEALRVVPWLRSYQMTPSQIQTVYVWLQQSAAAASV